MQPCDYTYAADWLITCVNHKLGSLFIWNSHLLCLSHLIAQGIFVFNIIYTWSNDELNKNVYCLFQNAVQMNGELSHRLRQLAVQDGGYAGFKIFRHKQSFRSANQPESSTVHSKIDHTKFHTYSGNSCYTFVSLTIKNRYSQEKMKKVRRCK